MRPATVDDIPAIRTVLGEAFTSDPLLRWIFPHGESRLEATAAWLGLFAENYVRGGRADVVDGDGPVAVALWRFPSAPTASTVPTLPSIRGLLTAVVGEEWASSTLGGLSRLAALRPTDPHAYLHFLAVHPDRQQQGLGRQVCAAGLADAEADGLDVHLETTNPDNLSFYRSLGFSVTGELDLKPRGPHLWAMRRKPTGHEGP